MSKKFQGQWEIIEMEQWDVEPGWFITLDNKGRGSLHFICVDVEIDYRIDKNNPKKADFTFYGSDEGDEVYGRGWFEIEDEQMTGFICFHQGDDSTFTAEIMKTKKPAVKTKTVKRK